MAEIATLAGLGAGIFLFILFGILVLVGLIIFLFVFWIMMIVDCAQRKFKNDNDKIVWILVLIFAGFIGAIVYYFVIKNAKQ